MNTNKTLSIIIPYIVLAAVFAALVQLAAYGFMTPLESSTLAVLDQLSKGADIYASDWGAAALCSILLNSAYSATVALNGGLADGAVYFMRVLCIAVGFIVSLVAYKLVSARSSSVPALCLSAVWMVLVSSRASVVGIGGLGADCLLISVLLGWMAYADACDDDGTQTGYARILKPVSAGFFAVAALAFSAWMGLISLILIFARMFSSSCEGKRMAALVGWIASGMVLALACYFIVALGCGEPNAVLDAVGSGLWASLTFADTHGVRLLLSVALVVASAVACIVVLEIGDAGRRHIRSGVLAAIGIVAVAACAVSVQPAMASSSSKIEQGPGLGITCSSPQADRYQAALDMAAKAADGDSVYVDGSAADSWAYLLFRGVRSNEGASWVLVFNDCGTWLSGEDVLDNYGKIAGNDTCSLYRRATTIGSITQG